VNDEQRPGVGFFRGLAAVVRGIVHVFALVLGLFGRMLALVTRRSRGHPAEGSVDE
jgi:hypothetical protein